MELRKGDASITSCFLAGGPTLYAGYQINLRATPELLRQYNIGLISRQEALRIHSRLAGTHRPVGEDDSEDVRLGLFGMNRGNQQITLRHLMSQPYPPAKLENLILLTRYTTLTTLDIRDNHVGVEGARALAANTTLTTLDISFNNVGDEGARALAANTTLTTLDISFNNVGDEGARALAGNITLTTLDITGNQVGVEGARALAANTTLTTLHR